MPTLLIVQIAIGRTFGDQSKHSASESSQRPGMTRETSLVLNTMVTTGTSVDVEEIEVSRSKDQTDVVAV